MNSLECFFVVPYTASPMSLPLTLGGHLKTPHLNITCPFSLRSVFCSLRDHNLSPTLLCRSGHISAFSWLLIDELGHVSKCFCLLRMRLNQGRDGVCVGCGGVWGNICGNNLIVSTRILSNQDASVCFPEPKADINNVAYPALCRLAEEC